MSRRAKILLTIAVPVIIALAGLALWLFLKPPPRSDLTALIPRSAIGFILLDDIPRLLAEVTETTAWNHLASEFGQLVRRCGSDILEKFDA